ncbi:DUF4435 domain-containing protein [Yersinia ruckeri]|uniref:DUF4435 domain-containing protein n=1 Tax=Yersinia ruckeri TaxID=29486 RepID=UPI002237155F|nr:DUF4435 domain-containing protein [Yersinia ruckeri]EKN4687833.1 DUF4435 domain-containing protein [Yersinia ruckeri]MCW6565213.1 DUF4435 domain-containing protein [Yersinia ruckeri]MCW6573922.1 DUF4435 domain-containing protein [Yersinia ruckeri]MCW6601885.1 DUF4435 domain-containing protein [Yersinia ruckeri]MCW6606730.1 DUF4435 domain-containing protein [Yersinia ruckeri]
MLTLPKRTIDDLKTLYFLEPTIKDIFVEGVYDKDVISSWCKSNGETNLVAYEIDVIDLPMDILNKYFLTEGNRQRVIALSKELMDTRSDSYSCLVDRDLDHWFGELENIPRLFWTEYCSLELYFFTEEIIRSIIIDVARSRVDNWSGFYSSFISTLKLLYSMRLCDRELQSNLTWISFDRCLSVVNGGLVFDHNEYIKRNLNSNGNISILQEFMLGTNKWMNLLNGDPRGFIRGHDFIELIALSNKNFRGLKPFHDAGAIERMLILLSANINQLIISLR